MSTNTTATADHNATTPSASAPLEGMFALTYKHYETCGKRHVHNQLRIKQRINDTHYLVTFHSWVTGYTTNCGVRTVDEMTGWDLFHDEDDWRYAAETAVMSAHQCPERG